MAAGWKKILVEGDAAALSDETAHDIGTTAAAGVAADASRHDHVHIIGTGAINAAGMFASAVIDSAAMGANSVGASEMIETESYTLAKLTLSGADPGSEIVLTTKASSASTTVGTVYFDSEDDRLMVYTAA